MSTISPLAGIVSCCAGLFVYCALTVVYNIFFHPLRGYPGPRHWRAFRIFFTISTLRGRSAHDVNAMHQRYGHVVRVAPNRLSFTDERAWRDICGATREAPQGMRKDERLNDLVGGDVTNPDPSKSRADSQHSRMRKSLAPSLSIASLRQQVPLITPHVDEMVELLSSAAKQKEPVDLCRIYLWTLNGIFSHLFLGESMRLLGDDTMRPWAAFIPGFSKATTALAALFHFAAARLVIKPIVKLVATKSRDAFMKPCLDRFDRRLRDRQATDRFDMVHLVLTGKQQVSVKELRDFSPFLIIAGGETMSSLLPCLTYLLLKHPKVLGRPRQEIRSAFAPEGPDITTDTLLRLSYLGACISEALRMYPPFVQGNDRVVPPGGASVCGLHLPGGTMVNVPHLATYHQSLNWFRPDAYHPERWLPEAGPEFERDRKASFKPFALGPQSCPGQE